MKAFRHDIFKKLIASDALYKYIRCATVCLTALVMSISFTGCLSCETKQEVTSESLNDEKTYDKVDTLRTVVMNVQKCSRLYTAEYKIHKIITHKDNTQLKGKVFNQEIALNVPSSDRKIAIPVDATLKAYIDFGSFTDENVVKKGKKIEIILPDPMVQLTSSRINHNEIKRDVSLFGSKFTDEELTSYERQGREAIIKTIPQLGIFDMAQDNAARIIIPLLKQAGYEEEDITVSFRKTFTARDIPALIDRTLERRK